MVERPCKQKTPHEAHDYCPGPRSIHAFARCPGISSGAIELIAAERQRQIDAEGWTPEHDDVHDSGELASAAISYALHPFSDEREAGAIRDFREPPGTLPPKFWPWDDEWWKPTPRDHLRELVKAGALIAAEIDRLLRKADRG